MMTNYKVHTLELGAFTTESGEIINNLKLRYVHVGYTGQPLVVVCHALTGNHLTCLLYTSPSPRDLSTSRMPSSA